MRVSLPRAAVLEPPSNTDSRVKTALRRCRGGGFLIREDHRIRGGGGGGAVLALGRAMGGDRAVHAQEPARTEAQGRPEDHLRHPARAHRGLPLVRLPGRLRPTHHGVQPLQQVVSARLLAGDAGCAGQGRVGR